MNLQLVVDGIQKGWSRGRELRHKECWQLPSGDELCFH